MTFRFRLQSYTQSEETGVKLLVYGINYAPEKIGIAVYSTGVAEEMSARGVETQVVTAIPYYPDWRAFPGWRGPFYRRASGENGAKVLHCPLWVPREPTGKKRIIHHATFALTSLPIMLWKALVFRPDVVFVVAPAMVAAPIGILASWLAGARAWLHIQDFEVEAAFATGLLTETQKTGRGAKRFERWVLRRFDKISTISKPMLNKLRQKGVELDRVRELRNWADVSRIKPQETTSPMKSELGIDTPFVALYSGNLSNKQGLEILPQVARLMQDRRDITFVVCGDGPMRQSLQDMSDGLRNIRFLPLQPLERLNDLLGMADVHLLPQIAGAADLVLPSKLTNMLASGRPVVATAESETALAEEVEGVGLVVEPGAAPDMAQAIGNLVDDPDLRKELGVAARARALARWDKTSILDSLLSEFDALHDAGAQTELSVVIKQRDLV